MLRFKTFINKLFVIKYRGERFLYDIITVGSATVDVFANTASSLVKIVTKDGEKDLIAYPSGSKIMVTDLDFLIGGGGTNTAVLFSRMGCKTAFLGKLGQDDNAKNVLKLLSTNNIEFIGAQDGQTGYSIVLDSIEHDRTILTFKGANNHLHASEVPYDKLHAKWLYSSSMIERSFATLKTIFTHAKTNGLKIAFNPSNYQAQLGLLALQDVLENCDALILNLEEAQLLLGKKGDAIKLSKELADQGITYVIITDAAKGATCFYENKHYVLTPSPRLKVVETTGAGDAFASGFISGLFYEQPIELALKIAMVQAESIIGAPGAKQTILEKEEAFHRANAFQGTLTIPKAELERSDEYQHPQFHISSKDTIFTCVDGREIASIEGMAYYLPTMPDEVFYHHVTSTRNDFVSWFKDIFHQDTLARLIKDCHDKQTMSEILLGYLHSKK